MKRMKKILAMLLALTMVLGMGLTSMAADSVVGNSDDTGKITVNGIDEENGITVTAYQIVKAKYENNGSFSGFELVYPSVTPAINLTPVTTEEDPDNIDITLDHLNAIIAAEKVDGTEYEMRKTATSVSGNSTYSATVPVGAYLVVITDAESKIYSPLVVSVNYVNEAGENAISGGTVTTISDGNAWVKESSKPTFKKVEEDALGNANNDFELGNSVDAGNDVNYTFEIGSIPYYGGDYPVFKVEDRIQPGLTYGEKFAAYVDFDKNGKIEIGSNCKDVILEQDTHYTVKVSEDKQSFVLDFVVDGEYTLNDYQGMTIIFKYIAKLGTADNNFNSNGYKNAATLTYTYDSKVNNENVQGTFSEETYTYTFDLTELLLKVGEGDDADALANAEFTLYSDAECTKPYVNVLDVDGVYVTDQNGKLAIKGLEADTYYLKETKAPAGYSVNTHIYKIEVKAKYDKDGQLKEWGTYVDGAEEASSLTTIPNTKLVNLPSTGGIGTTIFTVAGCGIMVAAAFFFFASRKKEN